jgi:hypothetical protein
MHPTSPQQQDAMSKADFDLIVGDSLRDNDPRMQHRGLLTVIQILPNGAVAKDSNGRTFVYLRKRIHTDGKARRTGMSRVR